MSEGERQKFEAWFKREWPDVQIHWTEGSNWCYAVHTIVDPQPFWECWQAARAEQPSQTRAAERYEGRPVCQCGHKARSHGPNWNGESPEKEATGFPICHYPGCTCLQYWGKLNTAAAVPVEDRPYDQPRPKSFSVPGDSDAKVEDRPSPVDSKTSLRKKVHETTELDKNFKW